MRRLAVKYRFEPGAPDDGMTVAVPLHLLNALDPARLSWLAPGSFGRQGRRTHQSLPKTLRRNFVPAPDFARAFAEASRSDGGQHRRGACALPAQAHGRGGGDDGFRAGDAGCAFPRQPAIA
jgi:ATP-dependent helicase HrpA